jgi:hypothetical protein
LSITPPTGPTQGGIFVTIIGSGLGSSGEMRIGGRLCDYTNPGSWNFSHVVCRLPEGAGIRQSVEALVFGLSNTIFFNYSAPVITLLTPSRGPSAGSVIAVNGSSFGSAPSSGLVSFGATSCQIDAASWTHTFFRCSVPAGIGTNILLSVTVSGQTSNALNYSYNAPSVSSVNDQLLSTAGSVAVTVNGLDFGPSQTPGTVLFGSAICSPINSYAVRYLSSSYCVVVLMVWLLFLPPSVLEHSLEHRTTESCAHSPLDRAESM